MVLQHLWTFSHLNEEGSAAAFRQASACSANPAGAPQIVEDIAEHAERFEEFEDFGFPFSAASALLGMHHVLQGPSQPSPSVAAAEMQTPIN